MDYLIDVVRRHARLRRRGRDVQNLPRQPAHLAHAILLFLAQDLQLVARDGVLLGPRDAILGVVRSLDMRGQRARGGQRVHRSQAAGEGEGWERVEVACDRIGLRDDFRREKIFEERTFALVDRFMRALSRRISRWSVGMATRGTNPVSLEAVLRAEVALDVQTLAFRTLEVVGLLVAILAATRPRRHFGSHRRCASCKMLVGIPSSGLHSPEDGLISKVPGG